MLDTVLRETPLATWNHAGVAYAVAAQSESTGPMAVLVAAIGPGMRARTGHQIRPNGDHELAAQLAKWNGLTNPGRTHAAELILSSSRGK